MDWLKENVSLFGCGTTAAGFGAGYTSETWLAWVEAITGLISRVAGAL